MVLTKLSQNPKLNTLFTKAETYFFEKFKAQEKEGFLKQFRYGTE